MKLVQLNYYIAVVQQGGFTKAAEELFVSQSALSKSVRALEKEFETELIHRSAKEFQLTAEGQLFYEYAQRILQYNQAQTQELYQRLHSDCGSLSLGLPPSAGTIYFFSQIYKFRECWPGIELKITDALTSKQIKEKMDVGELDLGVMIEPFLDDKYLSHRVYSSEAVLVVSKQHPLSDVKSIRIDKLAEESFLLVSSKYMFHDVVQEYFHRAGIKPRVAFESTQWDLLLEMVSDGQGVSILPKPIIDKCYNNRVHQIHLKEPAFPWALTLIYRKDKFVTRPMQHFLNICGKKL
ncbi:LysR family transcriptional regulator [Oscillibacter sp.]|uniref:LysR family transcriptional regulator n=1 Tax=Oscillibacter sp. TaxID=1945593 RepID=UPI0028B1B185|nr:LysR family transcriptional regulator [Oscillibacter sp.]